MLGFEQDLPTLCGLNVVTVLAIYHPAPVENYFESANTAPLCIHARLDLPHDFTYTCEHFRGPWKCL